MQKTLLRTKSTLLVLAFLLISGVITLFIFTLNSNPAQAQSTSSDLLVQVDSVLELSLDSCNSTNNSVVEVNIEPTSTGTFKSNCQDVSVNTNAPGYTLTAKSSTTTMNYQNPTAITPTPTIASTTNTITSPNTLSNDTWGFAVQDRLNFNSTYTIDNATNTYAALPTNDTTIYSTTTFPLPVTDHTFFYAARLTPTTMAGSYATTVTYTAIGTEPEAIPLTFKQISASSQHTCAIASDDKAYCWGNGTNGQLGNGSTDNQTTPVAVSQGAMPTGTTIKQISIGSYHTCAIASDDKAYCWGQGTYGKLGNGSTDNQTTPVAVSQGAMPAGVTIKQISIGYSHTCAIASDDKAYCWGSSGSGQLGNGSGVTRTTPVAVSQGEMPARTTIKQISAGQYHTCAIASDDKAYCWGQGTYGKLGNGSTDNQTTPVAVSQGAMPAGVTIKQISIGYSHTCAIASDDKAYCWGSGDYGKLGNGSTDNQTTPVAVSQGAMPAGVTIKQISADSQHTCAIASDDKAYCWGYGYNGQMGNGSTTTNNITPVAVSQGEMPARTTIKQISVPCAIASDDKAYCWGNGSNGQMGNGSTTQNNTTPVKVISPTP